MNDSLSSSSTYSSPAGRRSLPRLATESGPSHPFQSVPATFRRSSLHFVWGRPELRLTKGGLDSSNHLPQRLSVLWQMWLAHGDLSLLIFWAMSTTVVLPCFGSINWMKDCSQLNFDSTTLFRWVTFLTASLLLIPHTSIDGVMINGAK